MCNFVKERSPPYCYILRKTTLSAIQQMIDIMKPNVDITKVLQIAKEAGKAILNIYNSKDFQTDKKEDNTPLTSADIASNEIICKGLAELNVGFPIYSEENESDIPDNPTSTYWLIDPLDGTKEFVAGLGDFTVNIALVENGYPILGVVYLPVHDEFFYAEQRKGSYSIKNYIKKRNEASKFSFIDKELNVVCSRSHIDNYTLDFLKVLNNPNVIQHGSSSKFTEIAEGKAQLYPRFSPTKAWDTAAAQIIVEEAGGKVMDFNTGKRLHYIKPNATNNSIIVTGGVQIPEAVWIRFRQNAE